MGEPVRRLRALLPRKAGGRGYRQDLFHPRFLQASGCGSMCLQGLYEPVRPSSGLREAHSGKCPHPELAAAELRLQARGRGPRSLLVASAYFGRSQYGSRSRSLRARAGAGDGKRNRGRRPRRSYRGMAGATAEARASQKAATILNTANAISTIAMVASLGAPMRATRCRSFDLPLTLLPI